MTSYDFFDTDKTGEPSYDLAGSEYNNLLTKCFEYCTSISFIVISNHISIPSALLPNQLPVTPTIQKEYERYRDSNPEVRIFHFHLSTNVYQAISGITDSIFKWIDGWGNKNPEDPIFYRADGSIFFSSVIHEGKCSLFPREDEDVSSVLDNPLWIKHIESNG